MINPVGLTVIEWTDYVSLDLEPYFPPMKLLTPSDWKVWARNAVQNLGQYNPPDPEQFEDWREWAFRFVSAVPTE